MNSYLYFSVPNKDDNMLWYTHLAFGFLIALLVLPYINPDNAVLFVILLLFASLLPDIDHPHSKIGKRFKIVSFLFEHRRFFHSLFALIIVSFPLFIFEYKDPGIALFLGYSSHLVMDTLTTQGIMYFHPLSRWKLRGFIATGGFIEKMFFVGLITIIFTMIIQ